MIRLTITVSDITNVMLLFTHIRLYTSTSEEGTYTYLDDVLLVAGQSVYYYSHVDGTEDTWYKSSYYNTSTDLESSLSDAVQGVTAELYHYPTYPEEIDFTTSELTVIRKIRRYIGDFKGLGRSYLSGDSFCVALQGDNKTIDLDDNGWPVYVLVNSTEKTTSDDPVVQGYQYLTFSGTLDADSDTVDIWYYTFKFSDRQIYEAYSDAIIPPFVSSACVTDDHLTLQAAIDLLENLTSGDLVDDGASIRDDNTSYDPTPGLLERDRLINRLRKQLDALIAECVKSGMLGLEGVLID